MSDFKAVVIKPAVARQIIVAHHYSHAWPTGNFLSFGGFVDRRLVGVVTYGHPASYKSWMSVPGCDGPRNLAELTRLWVADRAPRFVESRLISASIRLLRRSNNPIRVLVSFADPNQNHVGTVYQASNWTYVGEQAPTAELLFSDGTQMHARAAFDRFGSNTPSKLQSLDPGVRRVKVRGKHKYLYPVDKSLRSALEVMAKPYPRRPVGEPGDHPAQGGASPTPTLHLAAPED